jgi:hypothetical protein
VIVQNSTPTSMAFRQKDLYSTFFGTSVNDEIERRLFGDVDGRGSKAVHAFIGTDVSEWHEHFQTFFEFLDIQKIRTPKGLDWPSVLTDGLRRLLGTRRDFCLDPRECDRSS